MDDDSAMYFVPAKSSNDLKAGSLFRYAPRDKDILCIYKSMKDYDNYNLGCGANPGTVFMIISLSSKEQAVKVLTSDGYLGYAALYYHSIEIAVKNF
jgi:hypothetical protein